MKKIIAALMLAVMPLSGMAAGGHGPKLDPVRIDLGDQASLQRGARIFVNYCLSCHSAGYMRYNRMGKDLGISDELVTDNLLFAADKTGELMKAVMSKADGKKWFGVAPPDLSLVARSRGPEWIYTYMRSFYLDEKSPSGWNNVVFPHVAMPHVLYEWQGSQKALFETDAEGISHFEGFELVKPGSKSPEEYNKDMRDLTNFLVYVGEPAKLVRYDIGVYVLLFLVVFLVLSYLLKKEYWKDIH
jgi:ubiquinol-cytochrome c reductase cytochrome c1 subunit